ncbi:MAG: response regulator [Pseudomonadales bacterium]
MPDNKDGLNTAGTLPVEDRFTALVERSDEVIVEIEADTRLTYVSPNVHAVFGVEPDTLIGKDLITLADLFDASPAEELQGFAGPLALHQLLARGPYQPDRRIRLPGGEVRWVNIAVTQFDSSNGQSRATAVVRDITQRVQLEEQLIRAQKLESLGVLAGGVAHSFNNLLTAILGNVELAIAEAESGDSSKILPYLWAVIEAATRAEETTNQLLTYAGKQPLELSELDLTGHVRASRGFLRSVVAGRASLEFKLLGWLPKIQADSRQLDRLITNLVLNAVEACGEAGGRVLVSTGKVELDEQSPDAIRVGLPPGTYVYLAVRDDGEGIEAETELKVFDPFFTTRVGAGGLGLAAALGIARAHGGTIVVDSKRHQGSTVKVLLPTSERIVARPRSISEPAADTANREGESESAGRILVVDDEDYVRQLAAVGLARSGYEVLIASSGQQAVALFAEHGERIDLLVTDLAMPEMSGEELIYQLRRIRPDLPVLLMSGYSRSAVNEELVGLPTVSFIQKPFLLSELSACVRRITHPD